MTTHLPKSWAETSLREVCEPTTVWNPQRQPRDEFWYVDVSAVSRDSYSIREPQRIKASEAPSRARKIIRKDDAIFATVRPTLRRVAFVGERFDDQIASTAFCIVRANKSRAVPRFLYYVLLTDFINDAIAKHESGASYPAVNDKHVLDQVIPLPPKQEQEQIAAVLRKIQCAIEVEEQLITASRDLKLSAMRQVFTHGLRGEPQKETAIGMIPASWQALPLGQHLTLAQYGLSVRGEESGQCPILRMNCQSDGRVVFRDLQFVELNEKTLAAFKINDGDLLFNRTNSFELVGRTAIFRDDRQAVFASYLVRLTLDQSALHPEFVNYYFNQPSVQADLKRLASRGVSQSNISASKLKEYLIPKTSLDEQREIAEMLQTIDTKISVHERKRATLQELFRTMLNRLMTSQLRVDKLDVDVSQIQS